MSPNFSAGLVKVLGVLEILGAGGLIVPGALQSAPVLVPLAATGHQVWDVAALLKIITR